MMSDFKSKSEDSIKGHVAPDPDVYVQKSNDDIFEDGTVNPVYQAKARLLNAAIQEIGMGRYQACGYLLETKPILIFLLQWYLFIVAGFGWFAYVVSYPSTNKLY